MLRSAIASFLILLAVLPARAEDPPCGLEITDCFLARTRVGKRVSAEVIVKNISGGDLSKIELVLVLGDGSKEVGRSEAARRPLLPAGRSCRMSAAIPNVAAFTVYSLVVSHAQGDRRRIYETHAAPPADRPVFKEAGSPATEDRIEIPEGEFSGEPQVEAAGWRCRRADEKTVTVRGRVRNGLPAPIKEVRVAVSLLAKDGSVAGTAPAVLDRPIGPGRFGTFTVAVPAAGVIDSLDYGVEYLVAQDLAPAEWQEDLVAPDDPALVPDTAPPAAKGKSKAATIAVAGVEWVRGEFKGKGKSLQHTGDVLFLRFAFRTAEGVPVVQPATIDFTMDLTIPAGSTMHGKVRRVVKGAQFSLEAGRLTAKNATPEVVAFSQADNTLWVGLLRWMKDEKFAGSFDVTLTTAEGETWTWKKLEDPWTEDGKGPDAKDP